MPIKESEWNVDVLKTDIRRGVNDKTLYLQTDHEGRGEFSVLDVARGAHGTHQPRMVFVVLGMSVPDGYTPDNYDPDEDEFFWEDADRQAHEIAGWLIEQLAGDPGFVAEMEQVAPGGWSLYFGHREADGDYCLFFSYQIQPEEEG